MFDINTMNMNEKVEHCKAVQYWLDDMYVFKKE